MQAAVLRSASLRAAARPAVRQAGARRAASTASETVNKASETASKLKDTVADAAQKMAPHNHKASSDVPWMIGSVLIFAPTLFYMTAPPSSDKHHTPALKEKFKPHIRLPPDADADHHKIPESLGDKAGEGRPHGPGDHGLRAEQSDEDHVVQKQNNPPPAESASNHDAKGGLKGDSQKFNAAARGAQQAMQQGGGEAARDMKAINKAIREASASGGEHDEGAYKDVSTPASTGQKVGEALTDRKANKTEEDDKKDSGENKDEQL